jgi:hypothetical protein
MKKTCRKCGKDKQLGEFYKDSSKKDGYQSLCKVCHINFVRAYNLTPKGKQAASKTKSNFAKKYPHRIKAKDKFNYEVKSGRLKRLPCSVCRATHNIQGHHEDYNNPLDVIWLCDAHHKNLHAARKKLEIGMPLF